MFERQIQELLEIKKELVADEEIRIENAIRVEKEATAEKLAKVNTALDLFGYVEPIAELEVEVNEPTCEQVIENVLPVDEKLV